MGKVQLVLCKRFLFAPHYPTFLANHHRENPKSILPSTTTPMRSSSSLLRRYGVTNHRTAAANATTPTIGAYLFAFFIGAILPGQEFGNLSSVTETTATRLPCSKVTMERAPVHRGGENGNPGPDPGPDRVFLSVALSSFCRAPGPDRVCFASAFSIRCRTRAGRAGRVFRWHRLLF